MKFILTGLIKVRDAVEAPDKQTARKLFRAKYPALLDKEARITDIRKDDTMSKSPTPKFRNFYRCPDCKTEWQDEWDSTCNDECPDCGLSDIQPYKSEDIPPENSDTEGETVLKENTPNDPESMTDAERAAYWEAEYRRLAAEDVKAREALAKMLRCPAAWRYLMPEILKRIQ